jgi:large subunit ribosomal protein L10
MLRKDKEAFVSELHGRLEKAQGTFLVTYKGLSVEAMNRLRQELRKVDAEFRVVKNRLLKLASRDTHTGLMEAQMLGPTAVAMLHDDLVGPAKVLADLAKEFEHLEIRCGQISGRVIDAAAIKRLAVLPGREVLLAQALSAMQAVPASLVRVLNGLLVQLMNVLEAIEAQKQETA